MQNAVHIPTQAVFERDGKPFVYLRAGQKWEERPITIARRTESTVIIGAGIKPNDLVAMADPNARPGDKKKKAEPKGGAMGAMPGGGPK